MYIFHSLIHATVALCGNALEYGRRSSPIHDSTLRTSLDIPRPAFTPPPPDPSAVYRVGGGGKVPVNGVAIEKYLLQLWPQDSGDPDEHRTPKFRVHESLWDFRSRVLVLYDWTNLMLDEISAKFTLGSRTLSCGSEKPMEVNFLAPTLFVYARYTLRTLHHKNALGK